MNSKLTSSSDVEKWLATNIREDPNELIAVAVRASLRGIPFVSLDISHDSDPEDWAFIALSAFRAGLYSIVKLIDPKNLGAGDIQSAIDFLPIEMSDPFIDSLSASLEVFLSSKNMSSNIVEAIAFIRDNIEEMAEQISEDSGFGFDQKMGVRLRLEQKLKFGDLDWQREQVNWYWAELAKVAPKISWSFWSEWYQGFLDGDPLDWELQREVALIPDEDWDKGPEHIAELIDRIWEPYKLKDRIAELEALLPDRVISRHGVGGNNPPDDIETPQQALTIVWAALDDLKEEAEKEHPNWERVKRALAWLAGVLGVCVKWVGKKVDGGISVAVKTVVAVKVTNALVQPETQAAIAKVIESASKWINFFN